MSEDRSIGVPPIYIEEVTKRTGAHLPHWTKPGAIYAITFRLADSLPSHQWRALREEREIITKASKTRLLSETELRRIAELYSQKMDGYLRAGYGACWLGKDAIAEIVANAFTYFDEVRYKLLAWCIMPNHVHVVLQPFDGFSLSGILHSWKSFTSKKINSILKREGAFWQIEYYDRLIRNNTELWRQIEYVWNNPEKAGLRNWKWRWKADFEIAF